MLINFFENIKYRKNSISDLRNIFVYFFKQQSTKRMVKFTICSFITLVIIELFSHYKNNLDLIYFLVIWSSLGILAWIFISYNRALNQGLYLAKLKEGKIFHKLFSGIFFRLIISGFWATISSFLVLFYAIQLDTFGRILTVLLLVTFGIQNCFFLNHIRNEYHPKFDVIETIEWSRYYQIPIFLIISFIAFILVKDSSSYLDISHLSEKQLLFKSSFIGEIVKCSLFFDNIENLALKLFSSINETTRPLSYLIKIAFEGFAVWSLITVSSVFLIPIKELRLSFVPATTENNLKKISTKTKKLIISSVIIFISTISAITIVLENHFDKIPFDKRPATFLILELEEINGNFYPQGTEEEIAEIISKEKENIEKIKRELVGEIITSHVRLRNNAKNYIDWYYSMFGTWARQWNNIKGEDKKEEYLENKLSEFLSEGNPFQKLEVLINDLEKEENELEEKINRKIADILRSSLITEKEIAGQFIRKKSIDDLVNQRLRGLFGELDFLVNIKKNRFLKIGSQKLASIYLSKLITKRIIRLNKEKKFFKNISKNTSKLVGKHLTRPIAGAAGASVGTKCGPFAVICSPILTIAGIVAGEKVFIEIDKFLNKEKLMEALVLEIDNHEKGMLDIIN